MISVYGLGNPLMDIVLHVAIDAPESLDAVPGSMNLVDYEKQRAAIACGSDPAFSPGGSCANTIRGIALLSNLERKVHSAISSDITPMPAYTGAIGKDENGDRFEQIMHGQGVVTRLARKEVPTGTSAILVTPDFERTMFTYLGACREYADADFDTSLLDQAALFHTTGYMWDTPTQEAAARFAVAEARRRGLRVSFDIADPFVAFRYRDRLLEWLPGRIDILFANSEELRAMTQVSGTDEQVIRAAAGIAPIIAMKVGKEGCILLSEGVVTRIPGEVVTPRDTTGAGDAFAAGFLYGLLRDCPLADCGRFGNRLASRMVTVEGCSYDRIPSADLVELVN